MEWLHKTMIQGILRKLKLTLKNLVGVGHTNIVQCLVGFRFLTR